MFALSANIPGIQTFTGEFDQLVSEHSSAKIIYKEHPLNGHYQGTEESRDWMFDVKGYYSSFFKFWKKCRKEITT
jgi:deoxyribodipyrimidine photo-lyase